MEVQEVLEREHKQMARADNQACGPVTVQGSLKPGPCTKSQVLLLMSVTS